MSDTHEDIVKTVAGGAALAAVVGIVPKAWKKLREWWERPGERALIREAVDRLSATLNGLNEVIGGLAEEMRATSESLHMTNANVQILLDSDPTPRWWTDAEGRCTDANRALCKLFGLSREEMIGDEGHGWLRAVYGDHRADVVRKFKHAIAEDVPYTATYAITPRGRLETVVAEGETIRNSKGKVLSIAGTVRPIQAVA